MDTLRIGIVGAGKNTREMHLPGFQALDGVRVVSVANRSRASGQRVADEFGIPTVYDDPFDLIAADDTDAICIGTWPYMHKPLVIASLNANKHVLTEARLAMNAREAHEMLYAARLHPNLVTQVVPGPITYDVDETIIDLLNDRALGDLLSVDLTVSAFDPSKGMQGTFLSPDLPFLWRHDRDLNGMNVMLMGVWYEAVTRWMGAASSVTALTRTHVKSRRDPSTGHLRTVAPPDYVEIIAEMYAGPILHMRISEVTGLGPNHLWMFGTDATLHVDFERLRVEIAKKGEASLTELSIPDEKRHHWRVEEEFVNAIRGREEVTRNTFEDGVRYMEFTEAVLRSSQTGRRVPLPL